MQPLTDPNSADASPRSIQHHPLDMNVSEGGCFPCRAYARGDRNRHPAGKLMVFLSLMVLFAGSRVKAADHLFSDYFAGRTIATEAVATFRGNNSSASSEIGEPSHGGSDARSLWAGWRAPANGTVSIDTLASSINTVLAVYVGSQFGGMERVQANENYSGLMQSKVVFDTRGGETYQIAVDGEGTKRKGNIVLNISFQPGANPPSTIGANRFANRKMLAPGTRAIGVANNLTADLDIGETKMARGYSVWWSWRAPDNGNVVIDTLRSEINTELAVFTGDAVNALEIARINDNVDPVTQSRVAFQAAAGQIYQIRVDGSSSVKYRGNIVLDVKFEANERPASVVGSDAFRGRKSLGIEAQAIGIANNAYAGKDIDEANLQRGRTVWWTWQAPASGPVTIDTFGSEINTYLLVATGSVPGNLRLVADSADVPNSKQSRVQFEAMGGQDYEIVVDGQSSVNYLGNIQLNLDFKGPLPQPPAIVKQPADQTVEEGQTAIFRVEASGTAPLHYQWKKDGLAMAGATQGILSLSSVTPVHEGAYTVEVRNAWGEISSQSARLTVIAKPVIDPPVIIQHPLSQSAKEGQTVTFTVVASGEGPLTYQWMKNGAAFPGGETQPTLVLNAVSEKDQGSYMAVVTNPGGSTASAAAELEVAKEASHGIVILQQPQSQTVEPGRTVRFSVMAADTLGQLPRLLSYQWRKDGMELENSGRINGVDMPFLIIRSATIEDAGAYQVLVGLEDSWVASDPAQLIVETSASPFVRSLPAQYIPGQPFTVEISISPLANTASIGLEDVAPAGWFIQNVSHQGRWDEATGKVKWVFFDADAKTVSYQAIPPGQARGAHRFAGQGSLDGNSAEITGDVEIDALSRMPADLEPADGRLGLHEVTRYVAAYQRGAPWGVEPSPIPLSYAVRAATLYLHGESYHWVEGNAPLCWVPAATQPDLGQLTARAASAHHGAPVTVRKESDRLIVQVTPPAPTYSYGVELSIPAGWTVLAISDSGELDMANRAVKWVFLDNQPRELIVTLDPATATQLSTTITAMISFDGSEQIYQSEPARRQAGFTAQPVMTPAGCQLQLIGCAGVRYVIEASHDLSNWQAISEEFEGSDAPVTFIDDSHLNAPMRFYRLRALE